MTRDNPSATCLAPLVVLAAILARLIVLIPPGGRFADPDHYGPLAASIAAGDGFSQQGRPTAYRPPLYPLLLAPFYLGPYSESRLPFELAILHATLGGGAAGLTMFAARRLGLSGRRAAVAGLIVALDPVLVWQARFMMTETPTAFLVALATASAAMGRRGAIGAGLALGLGSLCRPSILPGALLTAVLVAVAAPGTRRERLTRGLSLMAAVVVMLAPWAVRNRLALGEFVWTTTHGGYTLALANNEVYYRQVLDGPRGSVWSGPEQRAWWDSVNQRTAGMPEPVADRFLRDDVVLLARREPAIFARACLARVVTFWSPMPASGVYSRSVRLVTAVWTIPLLIALSIGAFSPIFRRWPGIVAPCLIVGLTIVHTFYWTDLRMRAPIIPAVALMAASVWTRRSA